MICRNLLHDASCSSQLHLPPAHVSAARTPACHGVIYTLLRLLWCPCSNRCATPENLAERCLRRLLKAMLS